LNLEQLLLNIEIKRQELDNMVLSNLSELSSEEIIKLSHELDYLISVFFELSEYEKTV
jgi:hypothetical protein